MFIDFESPAQLIDRLKSEPTNTSEWLLFVADAHAAEIPALLTLAEQTGLRLHGGIFPGLITPNGRRDTGIIAKPLPSGTTVVEAILEQDAIKWRAPFPERSETEANSALVFLDCKSPNVIQFLDEIYDQYSTSISYAGAGSGFHDLRDEASIISNNRIVRHAGIVILFPGSSDTNVKHGWRRTAGPFIATRVNGNVIQELNWEPAGSFYRNEVGKLAPELKDKEVFPHLNSIYPLSIARQSTEDVVRDPIEITDDDEIVVLSELKENSAIYIVEGDKGTLINAARDATNSCRSNEHISHCFVSDCFSRALMLEADLQQELDQVSDALQQFTDVEIEGVLALGEICGNKNSSLSFYNKTFVISLLHDPASM